MREVSVLLFAPTKGAVVQGVQAYDVISVAVVVSVGFLVTCNGRPVVDERLEHPYHDPNGGERIEGAVESGRFIALDFLHEAFAVFPVGPHVNHCQHQDEDDGMLVDKLVESIIHIVHNVEF